MVDDEEEASGATWGNYHVVGTYDGERFPVSDVSAPGSFSGEDLDVTKGTVQIGVVVIDKETHAAIDERDGVGVV